MFGLDGAAGVVPALAQTSQHRYQNLIPRPHCAALAQGLGDQVHAGSTIEAHCGTCQTSRARNRTCYGDDRSATGAGAHLGVGDRRHDSKPSPGKNCPSRVRGRDTRSYQSLHPLKGRKIVWRVASMGAHIVLRGPDAITAIPGAQSGRGHTKPASHGRDSDRGCLSRFHRLIVGQLVNPRTLTADKDVARIAPKPLDSVLTRF